jgi:type IV pilus assembly protein PilW
MDGFSLIEVMVALVIGLIGMLVMMQAFALFEGQKRTTTGGSDAQNTGVITLYTLQRDLQQAGYGVSAMTTLGCNLTLPSGITINNIAPLTINAASSVVASGDANTDTLMIFYGTGNSPTEGDRITTQPGAATYAVQTPTSFNAGDQVIAVTNTALARPNPCNLVLTKVQSSGGTAVPFSSNVTVANGVAGVTNGLLFNLGASPAIHAYAVRNGNLTMCDYAVSNCGDPAQTANPQVWPVISRDTASMRAQYGRDTTLPGMDGIVDIYDQATPVTACSWARISAVRLALVTRNGQYERAAVTTAAPGWDGGPASGVAATPAGSASTPIDLTAVPNWQHYRYKTFQTTAPLRNVTWMGVQPGC